MVKIAAEHHILEPLQTFISDSLFCQNNELTIAAFEEEALKALQEECLYKVYYDSLVDDVPLSLFNGYRDMVYIGQRKPYVVCSVSHFFASIKSSRSLFIFPDSWQFLWKSRLRVE